MPTFYCIWKYESYDTETDLKKRFNKIVKVMETISELNLDELKELKNEMQDVIVHNYLNFFKNNEIRDLFKLLQCDFNKKALI